MIWKGTIYLVPVPVLFLSGSWPGPGARSLSFSRIFTFHYSISTYRVRFHHIWNLEFVLLTKIYAYPGCGLVSTNFFLLQIWCWSNSQILKQIMGNWKKCNYYPNCKSKTSRYIRERIMWRDMFLSHFRPLYGKCQSKKVYISIEKNYFRQSWHFFSIVMFFNREWREVTNNDSSKDCQQFSTYPRYLCEYF